MQAAQKSTTTAVVEIVEFTAVQAAQKEKIDVNSKHVPFTAVQAAQTIPVKD